MDRSVVRRRLPAQRPPGLGIELLTLRHRNEQERAKPVRFGPGAVRPAELPAGYSPPHEPGPFEARIAPAILHIPDPHLDELLHGRSVSKRSGTAREQLMMARSAPRCEQDFRRDGVKGSGAVCGRSSRPEGTLETGP